jgi:tartrate/fumarate subfamily iron-sulfur-dependent hydro-lyase beta chain
MSATHHLTTPLSEDAIRALHCGDLVFISGRIITARDAAHKYLAVPEAKLPPALQLDGMALYHCGPVIIGSDDAGWQVTAAGPTTSAREETYESTVIQKYGIRAIIGKGGMGPKTLKACQEFGCAYLSAVGGAAQVLANAVTKVAGVYFREEFGSPEAMWLLDVVDFPAIVTMDTHGNDLHKDIRCHSLTKLQQI